MDVKTLCLGMLTFREASGYDLKKRFESSFGHFFSAGFGSIYPALAYLAETKLVTCTEIPQDGRPDRKVYQITEAGRRKFMDALAKTNPAHKVRSEFLAMLCFAHLMNEEHVTDLLDNRVEALEALMALLEQCEQNDEAPGVKFVTGFGLSMAQAAKKYIEENRSLLVQSEATGARAASG